MKRLLGILGVGAMALGIAGIASAATDSNTGTFTHTVGDIVEFITSDTTNATNATEINTWDVDVDAGSGTSVDSTDTVIIFRLVLNENVTLTGSFANASAAMSGALAQDVDGTNYEYLQTWANLAADGPGAVRTSESKSATAHDTGKGWSGIATSVAADGVNAGPTATGTGFDTNYNFCYIGGSASGSPDTPASSSPDTYTASADFLDNGGSGTAIVYVPKDGATRLRVTVRAFNGEDFGTSSDSTEAPDPGSFATTLTLTATGS